MQVSNNCFEILLAPKNLLTEFPPKKLIMIPPPTFGRIFTHACQRTFQTGQIYLTAFNTSETLQCQHRDTEENSQGMKGVVMFVTLENDYEMCFAIIDSPIIGYCIQILMAVHQNILERLQIKNGYLGREENKHISIK